MKLNEEGKNKLRRLIEEQLVNVPDGQRIHLDKEILEELLFETIVYKKETGESLKLPVWSGNFLRKIDLSEVSFENVSWGIQYNSYEIGCTVYDDLNIDEDIVEKFESSYSRNSIVDFSFTNANIDLNSSFESKKLGYLCIGGCNFSGIDLSKTNITPYSEFYDVNFSYTGFNISNAANYYNNRINFFNCNFEGNNYSNIILDSNLFGKQVNSINCFEDCNFKNTRINIKYVIYPVYNGRNADILSDSHELDRYALFEFAKLIDDGCFDGCFIDSKIILSKDYRPNFSDGLWENVDKTKEYVYNSLGKHRQEIQSLNDQEFLNSVLDDIDGQIKNFKR